MLTTRRLSILGLALCATAAGAIAPALSTRVSAASAAPQVAVVGHASSYQRMTLHITGSHFTPGSKVSIAVMNTSRWNVLAKGSTRAQRATTTVICGHDFEVCSRLNPRAGTIDYRVRLPSAAPATQTWVCGQEHTVCSRPNPRATANLLVLYRSNGDPGMQGVTLR